MTIEKTEKFLTKTALKERAGWTETLVTRLLGDPDCRKKMRGRTALLALYAIDRVELAERSPEFAQAQAAIAKRRMAAAKAVETKTAKLMAEVQAMPITVHWLEDVRSSAIASYNGRSRGDSFATGADDPMFLDRITVNYIRHELTEYDVALWQVAGKTGIADAATKIRQRVFSAIAEAYPALSGECERQFKVRLHLRQL